jgi:hypothetical protein
MLAGGVAEIVAISPFLISVTISDYSHIGILVALYVTIGGCIASGRRRARRLCAPYRPYTHTT